ncbi:MAG: zinc-binding alcohol dehydrogenase family protein [Salinirussus sp.]
MRAVRYHEGGEPDVLQVDEIDRPTPAADEVLVAVRAASINPTDAKRRRRGTGPVPKTTGSDFAGVVEAVGEGVEGVAVGDRVCGTGLHTTRFHRGAVADFVAVPTDVLTHLPDAVSFVQGAALALVGVTAWRGLRDHADLEPTDRVLIHGGTGGVGHVAVQLASAMRAHPVATANPDRVDDAASFGAEAVVPYTEADLLTALRSHAPSGYDVVFDHRAFDHFGLDLEVAAVSGQVVLYGGIEGTVELPRAAMVKNCSVHAMTMSNLSNRESFPSVASILERILDLAADGHITPHIARTYDLEESAEAHRAVMEDSYIGKLAIEI